VRGDPPIDAHDDAEDANAQAHIAALVGGAGTTAITILTG